MRRCAQERSKNSKKRRNGDFSRVVFHKYLENMDMWKLRGVKKVQERRRFTTSLAQVWCSFSAGFCHFSTGFCCQVEGFWVGGSRTGKDFSSIFEQNWKVIEFSVLLDSVPRRASSLPQSLSGSLGIGRRWSRKRNCIDSSIAYYYT